MAQVIIKGRVKEITPIEGGINKKGNEWKKREIIIEEKNGRFTNDVCLTVFSNDIDRFGYLVESSEVEATGWIETRTSEYDGKRRFNTSISVDNITVITQPPSTQRGHGNNQAQGYSPQQALRQPSQSENQQYSQNYQPQGMYQHNNIPDSDFQIFDKSESDPF